MSLTERTGTRSLAYSKWHRPGSIARFLTPEQAYRLGMIDIDGCEYCTICKAPLALIETQVSTQPPKAAPVMSNLARAASIEAYTASIELDDNGEPARFRLQRLVPTVTPIVERTPEQFAHFLWGLRTKHERKVSHARKAAC